MNGFVWKEATGEVTQIGESCVIGRSPRAGVLVDHPNASREHAMIRHQDSGYWLYDLDSYNGTFHNQRFVDAPTPLKHGDQIRVAETVFVFEHSVESPQEHHEEVYDDPIMATQGRVSSAPIIALVADIIGSCEISDKLTEEQFATVMNAWYETCQKLMSKHDGSIDKFLGDGMFGYWHDTSVDARMRAIEVARSLRVGLRETSAEVADLLKMAESSLRCGVGLHIGAAALGPIARGTRTVLGDAVNVAFRIEAKTRDLGYGVLATTEFINGWEDSRRYFERAGAPVLKGYAGKVELFGLREMV